MSYQDSYAPELVTYLYCDREQFFFKIFVATRAINIDSNCLTNYISTINFLNQINESLEASH